MTMLKRLMSCLNMKNKLLFFLLFLIIITRIFFLLDQNVNFVFDQGKDSLAILNIWLNKKPTLIGPWTSIPGLFFGPAYYYLLLPFYMLANGNPVFATIPMILLLCIAVIIFYYKFNKTAALILATSTIAWTITTSAWNPFPMVLISTLILYFLEKIKGKNLKKDYFFIGLTASLGFHFSTAFAIFYPIIIALVLLLNKIKINFKKIFLLMMGFFLPFIPQLIFEIRHNFIQTKAILEYLKNGESQNLGLSKLLLVLKDSLSEFKVYSLPKFNFFNIKISDILLLILSIYSLYYLLKFKNKLNKKKIIETLIWLFIPFASYYFLHFNFWYLLGLAPIVILTVSKIINKLPISLKNIILFLFILNPLFQLNNYYQNKNFINNTGDFLKNKTEVISYIYQQANSQSFASYQYEPAIYDYSYQYLFFQKALTGEKLPFEFSYKPGEISYIKEKPELLQYFANKIYQEPPQKIFFIVEKAENEAYLKSWWNQQHYSKIISERNFGSSIKVYEALP